MIGIPESAQKMTQGYPANYHTHTPRCHHAVGSEEEYIAFALERGLRILGFSDHTPYIFPDGYYSSFRMRPEEAEGYFETVRGLRDKYRGQLEIYAGLEAEYYPRHFGALLDFLRRFEPDYMILGQHCINDEYDGVYSGDPTDDGGCSADMSISSSRHMRRAASPIRLTPTSYIIPGLRRYTKSICCAFARAQSGRICRLR